MIITNVGRPVDRFPLFLLRNGQGGYLLTLSRVDVSDVGKDTRAEAHYTPLIQIDARDGMRTVRIGKLYIFIAPRSIQFHVERTSQTSEE